MEGLHACLADTFARRAGAPALTFLRGGAAETDFTYAGLAAAVARAAAGFHALGVRRGDRVILTLPNHPAFVVAHLAAQRLGAVSVPLNPGFKPAELAYFVDDTAPALIVCGTAQAAALRELAPTARLLVVDTEWPWGPDTLPGAPAAPERAPAPDDPTLIMYTSGTTGRPKGAVLSQANLAHDARNIVRIWEISENDVLLHALPLFHIHGLCFALHTALLAGGHVLMLDRFAPQPVLDLLANRNDHHVCTAFMAVPTMYHRLVLQAAGQGLDVSHVRLWTCGSAPLLPKDFAAIRVAFGVEPVEREGMSETGVNFSNPLRGVRKPGSIGLPLPGLEVRVVDPNTLRDVQAGATGELWLRGPSITRGYWRKPEETARAFVDGWFRTGDLGRADEDGYYYITDRLKNIIISGGENISPQEIESVIVQLDEVAECCVVGLPDERWGERVVAAVAPRPGCAVDPERLRAHCRAGLHDWKCPKQFVATPALPRNAMGKVLTAEVKKLFGAP